MARFVLTSHADPHERAERRPRGRAEGNPVGTITGVLAMKRMSLSAVGAVIAAALIMVCALPALAAARGLDFVIVVDCTGTMCYSGRDAATKAAIRGLVKSMQPEDRVTVYGYGEGAYAALGSYPVIVGDERARQKLVDAIRLTFDDDRTDITAGLEIAWAERERVLPVRDGFRQGCVILLTDGKLIPVYDDYSRYESIHAASEARLRDLGRLFGEIGVPIHAVGLGKAESVDGALLTKVAAASGGAYFHSPNAQALAAAFGKVAAKAADLRAEQRVVEAEVAAPATAVAAEASTPDAGETRGSRAHGGLLKGAIAAAGRASAYPGTAYQASTAALGVLLGAVAIGMRRRQSWTNVFTKSIGHEPARVKGYLKPVYPEGVTLARACIPLENPGHVCVRLGSDGDFLSELAHAAVEIIGTSSGAPLLRVITGTVVIDGEPVTKIRKLVDGDMIEIEGRKYVYLRGNRR